MLDEQIAAEEAELIFRLLGLRNKNGVYYVIKVILTGNILVDISDIHVGVKIFPLFTYIDLGMCLDE